MNEILCLPPKGSIPALLKLAKHAVERGDKSLSIATGHYRTAAEHMAKAQLDGATQREVAEGVGKSPAWVNRLLKWHDRGCVGAPFGGTLVQGVNKKAAPSEPVSSEPAVASIACTDQGEFGSAEPMVTRAARTETSNLVAKPVDAAAAIGPVTEMLTAAPAVDDYRLPEGLNRQDPDRAFQCLAEQWPSVPFRVLLLNSPKLAQDRFLREVLLAELNGPQEASLSTSREGSVQ